MAFAHQGSPSVVIWNRCPSIVRDFSPNYRPGKAEATGESGADEKDEEKAAG